MKIALITGGNRGLGKSIALNLAQRGIGIIFTYHSNHREAENLLAEITQHGGQASALQLDYRYPFAGCIYHAASREPTR